MQREAEPLEPNWLEPKWLRNGRPVAPVGMVARLPRLGIPTWTLVGDPLGARLEIAKLRRPKAPGRIGRFQAAGRQGPLRP